MSYQPNLFSSNSPRGPAGPAPKPATREQQHAPVWMRRVDLFLRVVVRLYLGLLIVALPWTHLWTENHLFHLVPLLAWITLNGAVRGIVSGLGLLNLWIAISDAIHYREP
ncbi:MAG: hypothetical protein K6T49_06520 [Acidobacterium ailaaui]|jgi:hypothetical protein|nr:hypothetical protein [Pseudacidobacterium ailaaui]